jgi:hypothetical protein
MTISLPVWAIVLAVAAAPIVLTFLAALIWPPEGGYSLNPMPVIVFVATAVLCWPALIVWAAARYLLQ